MRRDIWSGERFTERGRVVSDKFEDQPDRLGRRGALAAIVGATAAATTVGSTARAAPASDAGVRSSRSTVSPTASPATATIASAPIPGYIYRTVALYDFTPFDSSQARIWGGNGVYSTSPLRASVEIPAGALLRDIEWYVSNTSGGARYFSCYLWTPASGYINLIWSTSVPSSSGLTATRDVTTSSVWGPYPDGAKIFVDAPNTSSTCQVNGVRLGFSGGGLEANIRPSPVKIYDSTTTGGKFAAGETRTIALPGVPPGTTAAILRIITKESTAAGTVKVFPANQAEPDVGAGGIGANTESVSEATVYVIASRQVKVKPSRAAHIRFDLVGWLR